MKIKTKYYGVFYKNRDKWVGPVEGELLTKEDILWNNDSFEDLIKWQRKVKHKPVKIFRQTWESYE